MAEPAVPFDVQPNVGNHFAWLRTEMAMQRTLMAAVRTGVSLIGFGFTVAQFFEKLGGKGPPTLPIVHDGPRGFGLILIAAGTISVAVFVWQYHRSTRYLHSGAYKVLTGDREQGMLNSSYMTAGAVMLIGIVAFGAVLMRF